jgi:hypothetical protein
MELEFSAYGHEIQVTDAPDSGMPAGHSRGLVFLVDGEAPIGEVYDSGDGRVTAFHGGKRLGVYDTAENAVKAVVRATGNVQCLALAHEHMHCIHGHVADCPVQGDCEYYTVNEGEA